MVADDEVPDGEADRASSASSARISRIRRVQTRLTVFQSVTPTVRSALPVRSSSPFVSAICCLLALCRLQCQC